MFQLVTIETLSDDILLNIFRHNLVAAPRFWPTLVSVCQIWRQIVLTSPLGLNLRLHCTHGTPVLKALDFWPALPIIVKYGGVPNLDPPALEDNDNIVAALKQSNRVRSVSLTVTSTLIEKLFAISEPLLELEELVLLTQDNMQLTTIPATFRWGSRLRTLSMTRVSILSLPLLLAPCLGLIDIQLHEIPSAGYFPPEAFANALSGITQLQSMSLHFLSFPRRRSYLGFPHCRGSVLFSLLSPTSNIEELASIWTASWPESTHLISRKLISHSLANLRWMPSNLAVSSNREKCTCHSVTRKLKTLHMRFLSPSLTQALLHGVSGYKYHASS